MKLSSEVEVTRIYEDRIVPFSHPVIEEEPLALFINDKPYVTLMRLPGHEKELITGFLFTEKLIGSMGDILYLKHCGSGVDDQNRVDVRLSNNCKVEPRKLEARSACGLCSRTFIDGLTQNLSPLPDRTPLVSVTTLREIEREITLHQREFQKTGAVHAAALYDSSGKLLVLREDIGRHNALDKVIGHGLIRRWNMREMIVVSTGRASFEMAYKTLRANIPVLASVSAPTSMALQLSRRYGLTLIGFFRREGFNIYTSQERIMGILGETFLKPGRTRIYKMRALKKMF
jgi:FdhD protein